MSRLISAPPLSQPTSCTRSDLLGACSPRPTLPFRRNLRFQEFLRRVELRLHLLFGDAGKDLLADLKNPPGSPSITTTSLVPLPSASKALLIVSGNGLSVFVVNRLLGSCSVTSAVDSIF